MPLRTQKLFALAAIVLLALNLRTAVGSLSPVVNYIQQDIALPIVTIGLLGVAAPLAFAISTSLAYRPARRYGVELTLVITVLAIIAGHLFRALAWDSTRSLLAACSHFWAWALATCFYRYWLGSTSRTASVRSHPFT